MLSLIHMYLTHFSKKPRLTDRIIEKSFNSASQIILEVTEQCNFACSYCGYGEYYAQSKNRQDSASMPWKQAKIILDYYLSLWGKKTFQTKKGYVIGFYGGEPLLNIKLIQKVCTYVSKNKPIGINIEYQLTTNGSLLMKHIDFLTTYNFLISVSLDGDAQGNIYRKNKRGIQTFEPLTKSLDYIKLHYPDFFATSIFFQSVVHKKNPVKNIYTFFNQRYDKRPELLEISQARQNRPEIANMYRNIANDELEIFRSFPEQFFKYKLEDPAKPHIEFFLKTFTDNYYHRYLDFLYPSDKNNNSGIRSATCFPFFQRAFFTARGFIFPCEKVGYDKPLGTFSDSGIKIDFKKIRNFYNRIYNKYDKYCENCLSRENCTTCFYNDNDYLKKNTICSHYKPIESFELDYSLSLLERNANLYHHLIDLYYAK